MTTRLKAAAAATVCLAAVGLGGTTAAHADSTGSTTTTIRASDLRAPSNSSGAAGYEFLQSGVHIFTRDQDGYARLRWDVGVPLSSVHTVSFDWTGSDYGTNSSGQSTGLPGIYYDVDATGDGSIDCELMGERAYGGTDVWLNKDTTDYAGSDQSGDPTFCEDLAPSTSGGSGSTWHGTLDQWSQKLGSKATLVYGGMLANGLVVDGVMRSITFGPVTDTFTNAQVAAPTVSDVTGRLSTDQRAHRVDFTFTSDALSAGAVQGRPLRWTVTVNGVSRNVIVQSAGQTSSVGVVNHRRHGYKVVRVYKNGARVSTVVLSPRGR